MSLGQKLELRQSQSLVMTPQLQQAIKMLQWSNLELQEFVDETLERNPFLEKDQPSGENIASGESTDRTDEQNKNGEPSQIMEASNIEAEAQLEKVKDLDTNSEQLCDDSPADLIGSGLSAGGAVGSSGGSTNFDSAAPDLENLVAEQITLRSHLFSELAKSCLRDSDYAIARYLIDLVDEQGFMRSDIQQIASNFGVETEKILKVLKVCQGFSPSGIMAQDLKQCLSIQLQDLDRFDPCMQILLENLELVARKEIKRLCELCRVDAEDLTDMISELRALNPKPGAAFGTSAAIHASPDILVSRAAEGGWKVELNHHTLPRLLVNNSYYALVKNSMSAEGDRSFIDSAHQEASWLVRSLHQRAQTVLRIAREIVRQQDEFFENGIEGLRPLTLKNVAQFVNMHESTVSRVTTNKYIATPRGMFEMKFFFSATINASHGGEDFAAEAVRAKIKNIIATETEIAQINSDDKIVEILRETGVEIARRTVAKYREAMGIPSSVQRRREMRASF